MEADLRQFFHVDYRDRWRRHDGDVYPWLTLRQVAVYVFRRPVPGGAVEAALVGFNPVPRVEVLVDEVRRVIIGANSKKDAPYPKPHPDRLRRSNSQVAADEHRRSLFAARRDERRRRLEAQR